MKKMKFSVALLAVIIAVGSSFTTSPTFATDWFLISGATVTAAQYQSDNGVNDFDDLSTYSSTTPISDEDADDVCQEGTTYICAASIPEFAQNTATVLQQADLDYLQANRAASTIVVKLKN